jgi:very-short-patch-repair endonuclease
MVTETRKSPVWQVAPTTRSRARALRRDSTDAERIIWSALRAHRLDGASFRRQVPVGPYIIDFVCHAARLAIELDGGQHYQSEHQKKDAHRTAFLADKGFRVLRFNNYDVMTDQTGVLEMIALALKEPPSLTLPRKRGREGTAASGDSQP